MVADVRSTLRASRVKGSLILLVSGPDGRDYARKCDPNTFSRVAAAVTKAVVMGTTAKEIVETEGFSLPRVTTALAFLKGRGLIRVQRERYFPATPNAYRDAVIAFHALPDAS